MTAAIYYWNENTDQVSMSTARTVDEAAEELPSNAIYFVAKIVSEFEPVVPEGFEPYVWMPEVGDVVTYYMSFQNRYADVTILRVINDLPGYDEPHFVVRHAHVTSGRLRRPFVISASQVRR